MSTERDDLWQALLRSGEPVAADEDYEHSYKREVRHDLQQYVAFRVSGEVYGLAIHEIEEISKVFLTTHVPRTADFLLGIGNVRGRIMPVIDLARRLRLREFQRGRAARVLIVNFNEEPYGMVVDEVIDVIRIPPEAMEEKPGGITGQRAEFIRALGRHGPDHARVIVIILNLAALLDAKDFIKLPPGMEEGRG